MSTISDIYRHAVITKEYGDTHEIKRVYGNCEVNLKELIDNQFVVCGDGKTFYYLITEKT